MVTKAEKEKKVLEKKKMEEAKKKKAALDGDLRKKAEREIQATNTGLQRQLQQHKLIQDNIAGQQDLLNKSMERILMLRGKIAGLQDLISVPKPKKIGLG